MLEVHGEIGRVAESGFQSAPTRAAPRIGTTAFHGM
jgi:hypothetical protein